MGGLSTALVVDAGAGELVEPLRQLRAQVLASVTSAHSRRNYAKALDEFFTLWREQAVPLSRAILLDYRAQLLKRGLASSTINVRLSAVRKLVAEARGNGWIDAELAVAADEVPNVAQRGQRIGNWLSHAQAKQLLRLPDRTTLKGQRDYVILSLLVGCALRRSELATLKLGDIQLREGRWVIVDLIGKGRRLRSVAIPGWIKQGINEWTEAAEISEGRLLRAVHKGGRVHGAGLSDWAVWSVVEHAAGELGVENFGAHDLRRTCAKLCRSRGGDLEQIKFLLGHSSIQTTERYLGSSQELERAVNDDLGIE
jgi:integrase